MIGQPAKEPTQGVPVDLGPVGDRVTNRRSPVVHHAFEDLSAKRSDADPLGTSVIGVGAALDHPLLLQ